VIFRRPLLLPLLLAGAALVGCSSSGPESGAPLPTIDPTASGPIDTAATTLVPTPGAPSPREAVERFLSAQVAGDSAASFDLLADDVRAELGDAEQWAIAQIDLPRYLAFTVDATEPAEGTSATVTSRVRLEPRLDPITGFTPAEATVRWPVVRNAAGWAIQLDAAELTPVLPPDDGARTAADSFVRERRACDPAAEMNLLGDPAAAAALCAGEGEPVLGPVGGVTEKARDELVASFGPDATSWAREVPLEAPARLRVVLAPLGPAWQVIGLVAP
jgi:hypothetical protein